MLAIKGIRKELSKKKNKVVAVSPIIGNAAISGPTGKYLEAAGIEVSAGRNCKDVRRCMFKLNYRYQGSSAHKTDRIIEHKRA